MDDGQPTPAKRPAVTSPGSAFRTIGSMDSSPNSHVPATLPHPNPGSVYPQALLASNLPYPGAAGAGIRQDPNLTEHELQESLHALQQLFERECTSLYVNFQEAHAQLAAKHYQYSQRVVQEFMERQHQEQIARSAVANVPILRAASEQSMDQPRALGQLPLAAPLSNQQNRRGDQRATGPAPSSSSVSSLGQKNDQTGSKGSLSRTVSVETKNKLKAMIFNKQQAKLRQARSHVEIRRTIHGGAGSRNNGQPLAQSGRPVKSKDRSVDRIGGPANDHYEQTQPSRHSPLRKAVSEPDLKTKGQKRSMGGMPVDPSHENDVAPVSSGSWQVLAAAGPSVRSMGMLSPIEGSGDLAERSMRDVDAMDRLNAAHRNLLMAMGGGPRPPPRITMMPPPLGYHGGIHPRGAVDVLRNYSGCPLPIGLLSSELAASAPLLSLPTVPIGQGRGSAMDIMSPGRVRPQEPHIPAHMSISSPVPRNPLDGNLPGALSDTNILRAKAALSASHGSGVFFVLSSSRALSDTNILRAKAALSASHGSGVFFVLSSSRALSDTNILRAKAALSASHGSGVFFVLSPSRALSDTNILRAKAALSASHGSGVFFVLSSSRALSDTNILIAKAALSASHGSGVFFVLSSSRALSDTNILIAKAALSASHGSGVFFVLSSSRALSDTNILIAKAALSASHGSGVFFVLSSSRALSDTNILRAKAALSASHGSGSMDRSLRSQIRDIVLRRSSSFREEQEDPEQRQIVMETEASTSTTTLEKNGENEMAMRLEASTSSRITSTGVTGIAYDHLMCKHQCGCGNDGVHLEHPGRIRSIWARLNERDLLTGCEHIHGKRAPLEHLKLVSLRSHSQHLGPTQRERPPDWL